VSWWEYLIIAAPAIFPAVMLLIWSAQAYADRLTRDRKPEDEEPE